VGVGPARAGPLERDRFGGSENVLVVGAGESVVVAEGLAGVFVAEEAAFAEDGDDVVDEDL
jgi:hypothetical protein